MRLSFISRDIVSRPFDTYSAIWCGQGTSNDSSSTTKGKKRSREEEHHGNGKPLPETEIQKVSGEAFQ